MSKVSELLNPTPRSRGASPRVPSQQTSMATESSSPAGVLQTSDAVPTTTGTGPPGPSQSFNAADALVELTIHGPTKLDDSDATSGLPDNSIPVSRLEPSPTHFNGSVNPISPTTNEQYHSGSKSPEDHKVPHAIPPDLPLFSPAQPQRSRNPASVDISSHPPHSAPTTN